MSENANQPKLHAFVVFNSDPPKEEGADPEVYWFYSQQNQDDNFKLNITGLLITFISFCKKWGISEPCDYLDTQNHEIGLLELSDDIWMAISLESKVTNKRSLLNSILKYCKMMFEFFFKVPNITAKSKEETRKSLLTQIRFGFPYIVESINWDHLDITYLFDSYHLQSIRHIDFNDTEERLKGIISRTLSEKNQTLFDNIIILYSKHKVVTSTFSNPDISRAFSFAMRKKFKYMYQHNPVCQKEFSWLLGLYRNEKGITSVFQLPIYYKDNGSDQVKPHLFVAFKYHKFKIILTLKEIVYSEDVLKSIPPKLKELKEFIKHCYPKKVPSAFYPYTRAINVLPKHEILCESDQLMPITHELIHDTWIQLHEHLTSYSDNQKIMIIIPSITYFKLMVQKEQNKSENQSKETLVALQKDIEEISEIYIHSQIIANLTVDKKPSHCEIF